MNLINRGSTSGGRLVLLITRPSTIAKEQKLIAIIFASINPVNVAFTNKARCRLEKCLGRTRYSYQRIAFTVITIYRHLKFEPPCAH